MLEKYRRIRKLIKEYQNNGNRIRCNTPYTEKIYQEGREITRTEEFKNGMAKSIHRLEENGNVITDRKEILKNSHYFYETLYTSQKILEQKIDHYLQDLTPSTILDINMF